MRESRGMNNNRKKGVEVESKKYLEKGERTNFSTSTVRCGSNKK